MEALFGIVSLETFTNVSEEILNNLYISEKPAKAISLEPKKVQTCKEEIRKILSDCDFDIDRVSAVIEDKGWELEKVKTFLSLLEENKTLLLHEAFVYNISVHGETVSDFDYFLKLVCGADKLKTLKYPLLQLMLSTVIPGGERRKRVYDVSKEMLAELIAVLERNID